MSDTDLDLTQEWLTTALRPAATEGPRDLNGLAAGAVRLARRRRRRGRAGALALVLTAGSAGGVAVHLRDAAPSRNLPAVSAPEVRAWANDWYEPDDVASMAYRLPALRVPWSTGGGTWRSDVVVPAVTGMTCGDDVRKVARPLSAASVSAENPLRSAVVTGWGRGAGQRRFDEIVGGEGICRWWADPEPVDRTAWAGDAGWAAVFREDDGGDPATPGPVSVVAIERVGDLIVAVTASSGPRVAPDDAGRVERRTVDDAVRWADDLVAQVKASGHPAVKGEMPFPDDDSPVRYVVPTPTLEGDPGNPVPDVVVPAADLPRDLVLLSASASRPAREGGSATCSGAGGSPATVPDPRLGHREVVYQRVAPGVPSALVVVNVDRWPAGTASSRLRAGSVWEAPCPTLDGVELRVSGWTDETRTMWRLPARGAQARAVVGDLVVGVTVVPADRGVDTTSARLIAQEVGEAVVARLR